MEEPDLEADFAREFAEAEARGRDADEPRAVGARYLPGRRVLVVMLGGGVELHVPVASVEGLAEAAPNDLRTIEIAPTGTGLHFPRLDADVHVPSLVAAVTGSRRWMATQHGRAGGAARSKRKADAARANGRRGGRPRKVEGA